MKVSIEWLNKLVRRTMSVDQMVHFMELSGIEIEQVEYSKPLDKKIVVALITNVVQHSGADRLKIVTVDNGSELVSIVCGAPNVRIGMRAPLAQVGAKLPDGTAIAPAKLRGETSYGMLCSARELGLGDDHDGLLELSSISKVGSALCDVYPIEGYLDIKTPANRFDLMSTIGLAREIAAMADSQVNMPELSTFEKPTSRSMVGELSGGVRRLVIAELTLSAFNTTPPEIVARLAASGIRSLGLIVDITNYVMLETGQPLHAYDADTIKLPFTMRNAVNGESIKTLDGAVRKVVQSDVVVTDASRIVGIAGVRGGLETEISATTLRIYLEAASLHGPAVRGSAKRHNLRTDASARFEREIPVEAALWAMQRAVHLLIEHGGAEVIRWDEVGTLASVHEPITVSQNKASQLIGQAINSGEMGELLNRLELETKVKEESLIVTPPWWRPDLKEPEDVIEDLVKLVGYDQIPSQLPPWRPQQIVFDTMRPALSRVRDRLSGAGLFEVMTYSFVSADQLSELGLQHADHLKLKNPLSSEQAYLRTDLLASHLAVAERNRHYADEFGFYEISSVFSPQAGGELPHEPLKLAATVMANAQSYRQIKGVLDAIASQHNITFNIKPLAASSPWADGRVATIELAGQSIGVIGQLHPTVLLQHKLSAEVAYFEIDIASILLAAKPIQHKVEHRFPSAQRDITVVVPASTLWQEVELALSKVSFLRATFVSDYIGQNMEPDTKRLTLHLDIVSDSRAPTDSEADELETKVRSVLKRKFGAEASS
jgi:phenylalanyl-tRNA synthetase beta chain